MPRVARKLAVTAAGREQLEAMARSQSLPAETRKGSEGPKTKFAYGPKRAPTPYMS